jgi:hypothetical protein
MYNDANGFGGFGQLSNAYNSTIGDKADNGSCSNFGAMGVGGCHGPAGSDPDGTSGQSEYPLFESPFWDANANLDCGRCHGNPNRDETATEYTGGGYKKDPYGRDYDGTLYNGGVLKPVGVVPDQILGAPGADNRGGWDSGAASVDERKYIGQHEKHLNYSFRFSKGDSCNLCHEGHYAVREALDGKHGDGKVDVKLDIAAAGANAHYNSAGAGVAGQCFGMDPFNCHPSTASPSWDSQASFDCIGCHTMQGDINKIGHFTDPSAGITTNTANLGLLNDSMKGNCIWCHFPGHPTDDVGGTALILPNNPAVGINYKSGGIHLRKQPGGAANAAHGVYQTQAELCWGCHEAQGTGANRVSEWGPDNGPTGPNNITLPVNGNVYNTGKLSTANWTTATWHSAQSTAGGGANNIFGYKSGKIQSTHTTNLENGSSALTGSDYNYFESPDNVADIRCHNCHDVHNMNFAKGDIFSGNPYLRGSWLSNPYPEDGAPGTLSSYTGETRYGSVPRGGTAYNNMGGFQIDQNNVDPTHGPPTKGKSAGNSAGLCLLCHNANGVDGMDNPQNGDEALWIGGAGFNGHSNAALGGTAVNAYDILSYSQRNPTADPVDYTTDYGDTGQAGNPPMGYTHVSYLDSTGTPITGTWADGFRSAFAMGWGDYFDSLQITANFGYELFDWGVTQDSTGTINKGYHAFSCSKCHSPHASRLPKLLITNCLDTRHNTWDKQDFGTQAGAQTKIPSSPNSEGSGTPANADNVNRTFSNATSAQNCHRLGDPFQNSGTYTYGTNGDSPGTGSGWNKVSPWTNAPP